MLIDNRNNRLISYLDNANNLVVPNTIRAIGDCAFTRMSLQQITISNSSTTIEECTFRYCSMQRIIIPKGNVENFKKMLHKDLWDKLIEQ